MINKSVLSSPLGYIEICADSGEEVTRIYFTSNPSATYTENENTALAAAQLGEYFKGERKEFDFPMKPEGSEFQKTVWEQCRKTAYGETTTYKQIATAIGDDKAARAVGNALGENPILIAVPCHRVIRKNNFLSGFGAGAAVKEALLNFEKNILKKNKSI